MTKAGVLPGAVVAAAGIALSISALSLATLPGRDLPRLTTTAQAPVADIDQLLGLESDTKVAAAYCYDPENPPPLEVIEWIMREMANVPGPDFNLAGSSWSGSAGVPPAGVLTWSFVPDGTQVPGLSSTTAASNLFSSMDAKFGGNRALWISKFQQVFDRWQAITGVTYQRVTNNGTDWDDGAAFPTANASSIPGSTRGHIRISARNLDGAWGVLAFNYYPTTGDMVIDSSENWASTSGDYRFLRNTIAHEHGHGLGIAHVCPANNSKLMEPALSTSFDGPQHDDIRAGHARYGDFYESNGTTATATNLGTIASGSSVNPSALPTPGVNQGTRTSIDRLADVDWFKFTISSAANLNVTLAPRGMTYLDGPQNTNGSCSEGTARNTLIAADLTLAVYDTNGTTVLASQNGQPAGGIESISGLFLPAAGTYFVRVGATSSNQPQLYDLQLSLTGGLVCPTFTDHPVGQSVCTNQAILLYANAVGSPAPTFQWRKDGQNLPGQTETSLIISPATLNDGGVYDCVATNSCGIQTSNPAVVTVGSTLSFTAHPQSITVAPGNPANFSVSISGGGAISYEWQKDGQPIPGAPSAATYQIQSVTSGDAGSYACRVYNNCSNITSNPATLTVSTGGGCYPNCDGSTTAPILNVADFGCFLQRFAAGDSYANCDGSTTPPVLNVADFGCFLQKFAAGCP